MEKAVTAREAGDLLDLTHLEVIRRIRRGQIRAKKMGWFWVISTSEVARVRQKPWYLQLIEKRQGRKAGD